MSRINKHVYGFLSFPMKRRLESRKNMNVLNVWSMIVIVTVAFGDAAACRSSRI
jgi:hypothetical protein